jgi:hypothetical protein
VVYETIGLTRDLLENDPRSWVESVITISPDEQAGVKFTAAETPAPPKKNTSSAATPLAGDDVGRRRVVAHNVLGRMVVRS